MNDIQALFEEFEDTDENLKFARIEHKRSGRPDLHAFLLLDSLVPGKTDILSGAEHDQVWLSVDMAELAKVASKEDVLQLVRCGVHFDEDMESLFMFV